MKKKIHLLCSALTLSVCMSTIAQEPVTTPTLGLDIPTSPQAEAFKKLGEYKVDNAYGTPDIALPIWEVNLDGYKIPLVLRYMASPIKPGYNYDVYGLGWSLTGSSCVSRTIKGAPDEKEGFKLETWVDFNGHDKYYTVYRDRLFDLNTAYDDFTITLPSGRTIPFYISMDSQNRPVYNKFPSDSCVKIDCSYNSLRIDSINVTDESGVIYHFNLPEKAQNIYQNVPTANFNVSWLLTRIDVPNKGKILYSYGNELQFYTYTKDEPILEARRFTCVSVTDGYGNVLCGKPAYQLIYNFDYQCPTYRMHFLTSISYGPTTVSFNYNTDQRHVKSIVITDQDAQDTIRSFNLDINESYTEYVLSKLSISGSNQTDKLVYNFSYHHNSPGNYTDYWGNRGDASNKTDIGNFNIRVDKGLSLYEIDNAITNIGNAVHRIANRDYDIRDFRKIKLQNDTTADGRRATVPERHAVLQRITYPNGGYTILEFENHRFLTANNIYGDLELDRRKQRVIEGGGFRIKRISNYTAGGELADYKDYKYGFTVDYVRDNNLPFPEMQRINNQTHTGIGEAVVDPNLLTFMDYECSTSCIPGGFLEMMMNKHISELNTFENPDYYTFGDPWWYFARFSAIYFRKLLNGRPAVVYPEITIYHGEGDSTSDNIGKTVLKFEDLYHVYNGRTHYLSYARTNIYDPDTLYFEPVRYLDAQDRVLETIEYPEKRGRLKSKAEYTIKQVYSNVYADFLKSQEEYAYNEQHLGNCCYMYNNAQSNGHGDIHNLALSCGCNPEYDLLLNDFYSIHYNTRGTSRLFHTLYTNSKYQGYSITRSVTNTYVYGEHIKSTTYWDGLSNKTNRYVYSADSADFYTIYQDLKDQNILVSLLNEATYDSNSPDNRPGVAFKTKYAYFGNKILPQKVYAYNQTDYEELYQIVSYSDSNKPIEVIDSRTGIHTAYLWGYSGRYMVAKVQGATYSQVINALGGNLASDLSNLENIRNASSLSNALIETWTYKPLVGVTTYTDATGLTTFYEYDGLGRLKSDGISTSSQTEKKHSYEYNFITQ